MDLVSGEIIAIDKPLGWTSFDAVKRLRGAVQRRLKVRRFKVGHAGTLDPLASGVLLVCTGRATRRIEELQSGEKEYVATVKLGATTPSFDLETEIDATYPVTHINEERVRRALESFRGEIMQVPPVYSAVKVDGKRAYKYARRGDDLELKAKPIEIKEIQLLKFEGDEIEFRVKCSKGTYIRALARDLGRALDSGAHLTGLRRTQVGSHRIEDCLAIDEAVDLISKAPLTFPDWYVGDKSIGEVSTQKEQKETD
ncbi:MAG: tRNA pseudouridine(55) synthase TruB [Muribaculaceae bacterium]|nr:tRNA pseudouridine(55) synthase TruB [Muribaculaceae bacterium]